VALSKSELRTLALPGIREKINWHKSEIARLLEEAPELMTTADEGTLKPAPPRDPSRPRIADQCLDILSQATKPLRAGEVFRTIRTLPNPSTANDTSVYASLSSMVSPGLVSRGDDGGFKITAKGRKHLESFKQSSDSPTGGHA
jgi:hypothetical protein